MAEATDSAAKPADRTRKWTAGDRARALEAFYRTGSRRKVRDETGVPERTTSIWLTDPQYAEERRAVQAGLQRAMQQDAERRGVELAAATDEAILVCRKKLREDPDGKTASQLLNALARAREMEDRIARLDEGTATEIHGMTLSEEDREAFQEWLRERERLRELTPADLERDHHRAFTNAIGMMVEPGNGRYLHDILELIAQRGDGVVTFALRGDLDVARRLQELVGKAIEQAEEDRALGEGGRGYIDAPRPSTALIDGDVVDADVLDEPVETSP